MNIPKRILSVFFIVLICISLFLYLNDKVNFKQNVSESFKQHSLCLEECPRDSSNTNQLIDNTIYLASYNFDTKFSDWVAYIVDKKNLRSGTKYRRYTRDPAISHKNSLHPSDYKGLSAHKYNRGHQAPLASFSIHPSWFKTNYLTNITPQKAHLNQGPWARLESKVRHLALSLNSVYILTGPYYLNDQRFPQLPHAKKEHVVPSGYWKIVSVVINGEIMQSAFIFPQGTKRNALYCNYISKIEDIEKLTSITLPTNYHNIDKSLSTELDC